MVNIVCWTLMVFLFLYRTQTSQHLRLVLRTLSSRTIIAKRQDHSPLWPFHLDTTVQLIIQLIEGLSYYIYIYVVTVSLYVLVHVCVLCVHVHVCTCTCTVYKCVNKVTIQYSNYSVVSFSHQVVQQHI